MQIYFPQAQIDVIEIDDAVVKVAKEYFQFNESQNMRVFVGDGRPFIKRAGLRGEKYDYIVLDAFSGDYIPEHMLTREFLEEVKAIMTDESVLVANTFSTSRLYDHESVTYQRASMSFTILNYQPRVTELSLRSLICCHRARIG